MTRLDYFCFMGLFHFSWTPVLDHIFAESALLAISPSAGLAILAADPAPTVGTTLFVLRSTTTTTNNTNLEVHKWGLRKTKCWILNDSLNCSYLTKSENRILI